MKALQRKLEKHLKDGGASLVGFADLRDFPADARQSFPVGISIAVALDPAIISKITWGPTKEYYQEYARVNALLDRLGQHALDLLNKEGFRGLALQTTTEDFDRETLRTSLPHKTVATKAGLGWIGKNALLITEAFGSALRLASVLTDAQFETARPVTVSRCEQCFTCVDSCPGRAPSGETWAAGKDRDSFFKAHACCQMAAELSSKAGIAATICGICIPVCPRTRAYLNRMGYTV
ncbi:MAG: epoxyqueuosine reductase [Deltaproteobacteria bacterium]|nr:epoxyqueuosine reductase [Deltaproteobacteria bacterium]